MVNAWPDFGGAMGKMIVEITQMKKAVVKLQSAAHAGMTWVG